MRALDHERALLISVRRKEKVSIVRMLNVEQAISSGGSSGFRVFCSAVLLLEIEPRLCLVGKFVFCRQNFTMILWIILVVFCQVVL